MIKKFLATYALAGVFSAICAAQLSPDEAMQRLKDREAAASTQPDPEEIFALKSAVAELSAKNAQLVRENAGIGHLVPQVPRAGINFAIIRTCPFAKSIQTPIVFDATVNGGLVKGVPGQRAQIVSQQGGLALRVGNGQTVQGITQQHTFLPQFAMYHVFINNGTPFNPAVDAQSNIRAMTDAYVVLVNVQDNYIAFTTKSDFPWNDAFGTQAGEETADIAHQAGVGFNPPSN